MTKTLPTNTSPPSTEPSSPSDATTPEATSPQWFWLLKEGTAPKLGARAEGSISYNVLACKERRQLFIAITGNKGRGYFSKEHVNISKIEACLDSSSSAKPSQHPIDSNTQSDKHRPPPRRVLGRIPTSAQSQLLHADYRLAFCWVFAMSAAH